jgi:hypothetical protein
MKTFEQVSIKMGSHLDCIKPFIVVETRPGSCWISILVVGELRSYRGDYFNAVIGNGNVQIRTRRQAIHF